MLSNALSQIHFPPLEVLHVFVHLELLLVMVAFALKLILNPNVNQILSVAIQKNAKPVHVFLHVILCNVV